jgi:ureidoacrylate peracid hydrolase
MLVAGKRREIEKLKERAKQRGYNPPPLKYHPEINRDLTELLLDPEKTALLVIDVQNAFTDPKEKLAAPDGPTIVPKINKLVKYCREHDIPIIWVQETNRKDGSDIGIMAKYWPFLGPPEVYLAEGSHAWQLYPELDARPEDIYIKKPKYIAFWGSDLEAVLRSLGVDSLIFTGICTDICVGTTMIYAMHMDYNCVIVKDASTTFTKHKEAFLDNAELLWARVLTTDEVIAELEALKP